VILKQIALAFAPASLTEWIQFFRPITLGRMAFSAGYYQFRYDHPSKTLLGHWLGLEYIQLPSPAHFLGDDESPVLQYHHV
jgi:hypothetical protein